MKKILVVALIALSLLIALGFKAYEKNRIEESFEKKKVCASYKNSIEKKLETQSIKDVTIFRLDEIFFSPARNSCLYSYKGWLLMKEAQEDYFIADFLSNENVWGSGGIKDRAEAEKAWTIEKSKLKE